MLGEPFVGDVPIRRIGHHASHQCAHAVIHDGLFIAERFEHGATALGDDHGRCRESVLACLHGGDIGRLYHGSDRRIAPNVDMTGERRGQGRLQIAVAHHMTQSGQAAVGGG